MGRQPQSLDNPLGTVVTENHKALIVPITHSAKAGEDPGARTRGVDEPVPTITSAHRGELGLAQPDFFGGAPVDARTRQVLAANLVYYRDERGGVDESGEYPVRRALLIEFADGARCLLDILFRMLRPRELARAQSFPDSYVFTGKNEDIVKQIGNAVPVKTAKALCRAALLQMAPLEVNR
jgi:DNA (cytosine-5)-methyltransferase 1